MTTPTKEDVERLADALERCTPYRLLTLVDNAAAALHALQAENERLREALAGLCNALELPKQRGVLTLVPAALERARTALKGGPDAE